MSDQVIDRPSMDQFSEVQRQSVLEHLDQSGTDITALIQSLARQLSSPTQKAVAEVAVQAPVRLRRGCPWVLPAVLWRVQRRAPPLRDRVPHPRRCLLRAGRAHRGPAGHGAGGGLRRPPRGEPQFGAIRAPPRAIALATGRHRAALHTVTLLLVILPSTVGHMVKRTQLSMVLFARSGDGAILLNVVA
jgi:hypothetical protein